MAPAARARGSKGGHLVHPAEPGDGGGAVASPPSSEPTRDLLLARLVIVRRDGSRDVADLVGPGRPDLGVVETLARLQLVCRRSGDRLHLEEVTAPLEQLLELTGLRREFEWQPKGGEELLRFEEGVDPGNTVP